MKKILIIMPAALAFMQCNAGTIPMKFLNKTSDTFSFVIAPEQQEKPIITTSYTIKPKAEVEMRVPVNPQLILFQENHPEAAFVYQFKTWGRNKLDIRIVISRGAYKIEPQTFLTRPIEGNVRQEDIKVKSATQVYEPRGQLKK